MGEGLADVELDFLKSAMSLLKRALLLLKAAVKTFKAALALLKAALVILKDTLVILKDALCFLKPVFGFQKNASDVLKPAKAFLNIDFRYKTPRQSPWLSATVSTREQGGIGMIFL